MKDYYENISNISSFGTRKEKGDRQIIKTGKPGKNKGNPGSGQQISYKRQISECLQPHAKRLGFQQPVRVYFGQTAKKLNDSQLETE